jgi:signal transduction histidine kinase
MEMMLLNVILNARDAMPDGGAVIIATEAMPVLQATPDLAVGDYVRLSIADTGVGMSPDLQRQAFEPFFTTKDIGEGTGLGLSQVYGTAKQLGGTVQLISAPEKGTKIDIIIPCAPTC